MEKGYPPILIGEMNLSFLPASVEAKHKMGCEALPWQIHGYHTLVLTLGFLRTTCFPLTRKTVGTEFCRACVYVERAVSKSL